MKNVAAGLTVFACFLPVLGEEAAPLVSIAEMRKFLERPAGEGKASATDAGGVVGIGTAAEPGETREEASSASQQVEAVGGASEEEEVQAPDFLLQADRKLPPRAKRLFQAMSGGMLAKPDGWLVAVINDHVVHNDYMAAAALYASLGFFEQAAFYFGKILGSGGANRSERSRVASGEVGIDAAYTLLLSGQPSRAESVLRAAMESVQKGANQSLAGRGQALWDLVARYKKVSAVKTSLEKKAVPAPASEEQERAEAARLLALAALQSAPNDFIRAPGVTGGDNLPAAVLRALNGVRTLQVNPFEDVYGDFNHTTSVERLLEYQDLDPFRGELEGVTDADRLPLPVEHARLLAELIYRFPGHEVVQSGEAAYMLIRDLAQVGLPSLASQVAEAAFSLYPETQPARDGEFVYMAAEFAYYGREWKRAFHSFRMLQARFPDHRAVQMGVVGARIASCKERMRKSGLIVR